MIDTKSNMFAVVYVNPDYSLKLYDVGNYADYDRLGAYIMYKFRLCGLQSKADFTKFYNAIFYNRDYTFKDQLAKVVSYGDLSTETEDASFYSEQRTFNLLDYDNHEFDSFDSRVIYNRIARQQTYTLILAVHKSIDKKYYIVDYVVKPEDIWKEQHDKNTWVSKYAVYYPWRSIDRLTSKKHSIDNSVPGHKINVSCGNNMKRHAKHLYYGYEPTNHAVKIRKEYDLPVTPKHCSIRHREFSWDMIETYRSKRGKSWKLHKFKHQYEHNLVYNHKRNFTNYCATKLNRGCYEYYTDYEKYKYEDFADSVWDSEETANGEMGCSKVSLACLYNIGATC